jgi:hypothetical protein
MPDKPEDSSESTELTLGPQTRVTFMGVTIISLLAGLCVGAWSASAAFWRLNANIDKKVTRTELTRWTRDAQRAVPTLPIYVPDGDGDGR